MSRIIYNEDEDFPGQGELWQANVERSLRGRAGQRALRELLEALEALPDKRLIEGHLVKDGEVCTLGALVVEKKSLGRRREEVLEEFNAALRDATGCTCLHRRSVHADGSGRCETCDRLVSEDMHRPPGRRLDFKPCLSFTEDPYDDEDGYEAAEDTKQAAVDLGVPRLVAWRLMEVNDEWYGGLSPEERYEKVVAWVRKHLQPEAVPA
jgi:hypothetical protein